MLTEESVTHTVYQGQSRIDTKHHSTIHSTIHDTTDVTINCAHQTNETGHQNANSSRRTTTIYFQCLLLTKSRQLRHLWPCV